MGFTVRREPNGVVVIGVDGQLIVSNRHELKERVAEAMDFGSRKVLVDFTATGYIDSSGLGALVSLAKKLREAGGELRLAGLNEDLRTLFELTKRNTLLSFTATADEALQGF